METQTLDVTLWPAQGRGSGLISQRGTVGKTSGFGVNETEAASLFHPDSNFRF